MIDREKVIRAINGCINIGDYCNDCDYDGCVFHHGSCEKDLLADALELLKEQGWIPITERLPKDDTDILVYCTDGEESRIVAVNYANGVWFDCVFNTVMVVENITHWMPVPKPPKEGR